MHCGQFSAWVGMGGGGSGGEREGGSGLQGDGVCGTVALSVSDSESLEGVSKRMLGVR